MSFEEKGSWIFAVVALALATVYFGVILSQLSGTPPTEIDYQPLLVAAIVATIVLVPLGMIGAGIASPADAGKSDQRDKDINRLGEYVGGIVLGFGMILPFALAMVEASHFWIANTMYLIFVVAGLSGTAVKLALYRRGF